MAEFSMDKMAKSVAERAMEELKDRGVFVARWIPIKTRPMTEEETEHYFEHIDQRVDDAYTILDCPLPEDGEEVLVSWGNNVCVDIFVRDTDGCYFEDRDIDEVTAWMPLPEPYKGVSKCR